MERDYKMKPFTDREFVKVLREDAENCKDDIDVPSPAYLRALLLEAANRIEKRVDKTAPVKFLKVARAVTQEYMEKYGLGFYDISTLDILIAGALEDIEKNAWEAGFKAGQADSITGHGVD
jgi:hypothetical protein